MAKKSSQKQVQALIRKVDGLRKELRAVEESNAFTTKITKSQARFTRIKNPNGKDGALCEFFMQLDVKAGAQAIYVPLSIASGKKPTGMIYSIEGTAVGEIDSAKVEVKGAGVTQLTVGTIVYVKVPAKTTATFRIIIDIFGIMNNTYSISIDTINFKFDPADARYKKYSKKLSSTVLTAK
jgi:hypothetical protein